MLRALSLLMVTGLLAAPSLSRAEIPAEFKDRFEQALDTESRIPRRPTVQTSILATEIKTLLARRSPDAVAEAKEKAYRLSLIFLEQRRPQEAIWALDGAGLFELGDYGSLRYRNFLQTTPIANPAPGGGASATEMFSFGGGHGAVAKHIGSDPAPRLVEIDQSRLEVFAFEFDRLIGLNRVPTTVFRVNKAGAEVSAQALVPNTGATEIDFRDEGYTSKKKFVEDVWLIDYLLQNSDRHWQNSLYTLEGDIVLIDQGRTFHVPRGHSHGALAPEPKQIDFAINQDLLRNLHDLPVDLLRERYVSLIGEELMNDLVERIQNVRRAFARPNGPSLRRRGWENAPVRPCKAVLASHDFRLKRSAPSL